MATATYTTKSQSNWIRYPGDNTASRGGSHIVGWEGARYRIEKYTFTTGNYPITAVNINFGSVSHYGGNTSFTIYYRITKDSDCEKSLAGEDSSHTGIVSISNGKATASKTINLAKNTTYYIYVWSKKLSGEGPDYWGAKNWSSSAATITATETQTTKCSAPTSVTVSKTIVSPTGSFKISWSGAKGGSNNQIVSYDVYLKVSSTGTEPTVDNYDKRIWVDVADGTTSGSKTINLSDLGIPLTRGHKIVCGVVTRGWAEENYYSGIKIGSPVKINQLPESPKIVSTNTRVVSASGTEVIFNVTAGSEPDEQSRTLYYATSSTGTKTKFTSPLSKTLNAAATYYFYTYDGIEYSPATSINITLNTKPVIKNIEVNTISTYTALNGNGINKYQKGYADKIQPKITANKSGTLKIIVEMSNSNNTDSTTTYDQTYTFKDYKLTSYDNVILDTYDINIAAVRKFSETIRKFTNIKWRLKFVLTDGIDDSDAKYFPTEEGHFYAIAHAPSLRDYYNQFDNKDIKGTNKGEIWREVRMKFYNDTSTPIVSVTATATTPNGKVISLNTSVDTSTSGNERYVDITLPDGIEGGSDVQITASLTNSDKTIKKEVSCAVKETAVPNMGPLTHGGTIIYPFTDTGTYQISMAWPFGNYEDINTALTAYNCSTNTNESIKFVHASDTSGSNLVIKVLNWGKNSNTISTTLDGSTAYGWKNELGQNELGYDTYAGQKTYYCQIQITNLFGKTYTSEPENGGWLSRIFDFNETAQNLQISSIQWATSNTDSTEWKNFNTVSETSDGNAAQEGMYLKFNLSFDLFTEEAITVQLKRKINDEESILIPKTYSKGELKYATGRTAKNNTDSLVYGPIGNISDTENRVWNFQVISARGTASTAHGVTMKVQRQTAPDINFTSCSVDQNYKISYSFKQTDSGGGSIENYLCDYDNKNELSSESLKSPSSDGTSSGDIQLEPNVSDWETKSICIKSVSTVNGLIKLEKEYYSNYIIVYKVTPTIAYRKNQLGINTDNPDTDYIIDIRPTNENKRIRLYNGISDVIELDLSKVYNNGNNSCPAIVIKKETNEGTSKKITEYTLLFD